MSEDPVRLLLSCSGVKKKPEFILFMRRFATEKYSLAKESLENTYIHLTNFTLNKKGERVTDYPPGCQVA